MAPRRTGKTRSIRRRDTTIEIPLHSFPRYKPGSGPAPLPIALELPRDSTGYILEEFIDPPPAERTSESRVLPCYLIGFTDLPNVRFTVPCHRADEYIAPQVIEDWQFEREEQRRETREREAQEKAQEKATKTKNGTGRPVGRPRRTSLVSETASPSLGAVEQSVVLAQTGSTSLATPRKRKLPKLREIAPVAPARSGHDAGTDAGVQVECDDETEESDETAIYRQLHGIEQQRDDVKGIATTLVAPRDARARARARTEPSDAGQGDHKRQRVQAGYASTWSRRVTETYANPSSAASSTSQPATPREAEDDAARKEALRKEADAFYADAMASAKLMDIRPLRKHDQDKQGSGTASRRKSSSDRRAPPHTVPEAAPSSAPAKPALRIHPMFAKAVGLQSHELTTGGFSYYTMVDGKGSKSSTPAPSTQTSTPQPRLLSNNKSSVPVHSLPNAPTARQLSTPIPVASPAAPAGSVADKVEGEKTSTDDKDLLDGDYEVKQLLRSKRALDKKGHMVQWYQVLWEGDWPADQNPTWEPASNIPDNLRKAFDQRKAKKGGKKTAKAQKKPAAAANADAPKKRYRNVAEAVEGDLHHDQDQDHDDDNDDDNDDSALYGGDEEADVWADDELAVAEAKDLARSANKTRTNGFRAFDMDLTKYTRYFPLPKRA